MELKNLRNKLHISQTEIANSLGISSQRYNKYELGVNEPDIETLKKLADFFHTSVDAIIGYSPRLRENDKYNSIMEILNTCNAVELSLILQFVEALKHSN